MVIRVQGTIRGDSIQVPGKLGFREGEIVEVTIESSPPRIDNASADEHEMDSIYAILDERYASGHTDTAERHNEHQP